MTKAKTIFAFVIGSMTGQLYGQLNYFNYNDTIRPLFSNIICLSDGYATAGLSYEFSSQALSSSLLKMDLHSNIIDTVMYSNYPEASSAGRLTKLENSFSLVFQKNNHPNDCTESYFDVINYDFNLNQNWKVSIDGLYSYQTNAICSYESNTYVIGGVCENQSEKKFKVIKIDSLGNILWEKLFDKTTLTVTSNIMALPNGSIVIAYATYETVGGYNLRAIQIDSVGNIIWDKNISNSSYDEVSTAITLLKDKTLLFAINKSHVSHSSDQKVELIKLNYQGEVIFQKTIDFSPINGYGSIANSNPIETQDGSIMIPITSLDSMNNPSALLVKFSPLLDSIWTKKYIYNSNRMQYIYFIKQTADDGFIFGGSSMDNNTVPHPIGKLIKTDCNGAEGVLYPLKQPCYYYDCTQYPVVSSPKNSTV